MGFDPFKAHYLKSNIFEKKVVYELLRHFKNAQKISESEVYIPSENELIIVDYFLTIRRRFTDNFYIYRKKEILERFSGLSVNKVSVIYDFEHSRFNNNFNSDPDVQYRTFYVEYYYRLNSITSLKKYEYQRWPGLFGQPEVVFK